MIREYSLLVTEKVLGLDADHLPATWEGSVVFDWKDIVMARNYLPSDKDIENGIDPNECTLVYHSNGENFVIRWGLAEAKRNMREARGE